MWWPAAWGCSASRTRTTRLSLLSAVRGHARCSAAGSNAIVVALLYGSWLARAAAALDLALLVFVGNIFGGLSHLDVAAVGHVTAMTVAAVGGSLLLWRRRRRQHRPLHENPAGAPAG